MTTTASNPLCAAELYNQLHDEIEVAKSIVYKLDQPTPVEPLELVAGQPIFAKREDRSKIHSYKWRGAFYKLHKLIADGFSGQIVAASAGNHAQGVAIAAEQLKTNATIFMPRTTPKVKQQAVRQFGGDYVDIQLVGDCYDDAADAALNFLATHPGTMLKPFDDLSVIAGQATVGLEMLQQVPDLSKIYVPIGGGGLASGIAFAVKEILKNDRCKVIGVEVENQNSMQLSKRSGRRITMEDVDAFCDGTAVRQPGELTFAICDAFLDDIITVSNEEVSEAIRRAWDTARFIPEPSGGIGLAAAIQQSVGDVDETVGIVITGNNVDFQMLPRIVRKSTSEPTRRRYFRFGIAEQRGALIELLDQFMAALNIVDFQYGKTDAKIAQPVLGIEGPKSQLDSFAESGNIQSCEISGESLSEFRVIPFRPDLCREPFFLKVDFPHRPGALRELMRRISSSTNICYFNFTESGELEGHALIGFESLQTNSRQSIERAIIDLGLKFQTANG